MSKYNYEDSKSLSELFKEVQDIRYGRAAHKVLDSEKEEIKFNKVYVIDKKFNAVGAIIGILLIILFMTSLHSNYIFATTEKEKVSINKFEENENAIDMLKVISENVNELTKKEIVSKELDIEFETRYVETDLLPKDEERIIQTGKVGKLEQTIIKTYENDTLIDENIINETTQQLPVEEIIEVGTSEFLATMHVHIGDVMYTTEEIFMYPNPEETDETICMIYQFIDVNLKAEKDGWTLITVDGLEGYVKSDKLTSEVVTPGIAEKARIKRIILAVSPDMAVNKPSGLTKEDFIKIFSNNVSDTYDIFEQNAELFYEIEQKYNINGLFVASIGIHESNWGTSSISINKKNLFGYGSYDSSAYASSYTFESYQYGIELVSKVLVKYYLNEQGTPIYDAETAVGTYYNGSTISGVNTRYASDANWSNRVFTIMKNLYEKLQ